MSWSPFQPDVMADPGPGHRYLVDQCPVHHCEAFDPPFYTLSRYEDVENALRDIKTYSSHFGQGPRFTEPSGMLCDPPQHTFFRKLIQQAFTPKAIEALREPVTDLTNQLLDEILDGDSQFDFHDDFAFPLPVIIIAGLLGVPTEDLEQFKIWSDMQVEVMGAEDPRPFIKEQEKFQGYMAGQLLARRERIDHDGSVPDDLLTLIAGARNEDGGYVSDTDALSLLNQLLVGGNETTTSLITNLMWRLLQDRSRWEMILEDERLIPAAVEESLRFDPPVLGLYRNTTCDVNLHETTIPEGSKVYLNYAAANRDAAVFERPDEFDITRASKRHLSFGLGTHFCIGAPTARLEAEIALQLIRERMPDIQLMGEGERIKPFFLWGRRKLPVSY